MTRYTNGFHEMLVHKNGTWVKYTDVAEALALLRELNDALLPIPDALQARVDAILDVSDSAGRKE